jgi:glycosyltransferase involved in cell wall biosynthesis
MSVEPSLVSVVIPTYNYGHYVTEAVESALAQTYPAVEVIVIDDGSTDDTRQRLAPFGEGIRYVYQENQGLSAARNTGIREARGRFVAFLDSDDRFHPRKLELQMEAFARGPELGLVGTVSLSDEPLTWGDTPPSPQTLIALTLDDLVIGSPFPPSSALARAECFAAVGTFDTALRSAEDRDLWIRIGTRFPVARVATPLTWYRQTPGSMSKNPEKMEVAERMVIDKAFALPELRHRWGFRRKVLGLAAYSAAYRYLAAGRPGAGARRAAKSFVWSPIGLGDVVRYRFGRVRLLASCLLRTVTRMAMVL